MFCAQPVREDERTTCHDVCFAPDGSRLIAAVGMKVIIYETDTGEVMQALKGHKDTIYSISYGSDGARFASGSADNSVIVWSHKGEGLLKYSHSDSIQALEFSPASQTLVSVTATELGLWSPEQRSVNKHKISSKGLCVAWAPLGNHFAIGHYSGALSIRSPAGHEGARVQLRKPVWTVAFGPNDSLEGDEYLCVGCWDGTIYLYLLEGLKVTTRLDFPPCLILF